MFTAKTSRGLPRGWWLALALVLVLAGLALAAYRPAPDNAAVPAAPGPTSGPVTGFPGGEDGPDAGPEGPSDRRAGAGTSASVGATDIASHREDPDALLTWSRLHAMLRDALEPAAAPRLHGEPPADFRVSGADGNDPVTRAQLVTAVVQALELEDVAEAQRPADSPFQDISPLHRAFGAVTLAHRLGLTPHRPGDLFRPEQAVTVAEAQEIMAVVHRLEVRTGRLAQVNEAGRSLQLADETGDIRAYVLLPDALLVRNGEAAGAAQLQVDDDVRAVADGTGLLRVVTARGPEASSSQEVLAVIGAVLRELLTPEQTAAIMARDWERAETELKVSLYNQLLEYGLTPHEAAAVLEQDWTALTEHGKERLTAVAAARWSVAPELVRALLDEDWDTALSYAEVTVLEYLLNELMEAANA